MDQWNTRFTTGLLKIFIDNMEDPFLTTFVNLGEMIGLDTFQTPPIGKNSGKGYISIAAATSNSANPKIKSSLNYQMFTKFRNQSPNEFEDDKSFNQWWMPQTKTDKDGNFESYGQFNVVRFRFKEWPKCGVNEVICTQTANYQDLEYFYLHNVCNNKTSTG